MKTSKQTQSKPVMTLKEALTTIEYSNSWGIWAETDYEGKVNLESDSRFGQRCFENGGLLDDFVYICSGEWPSDRFVSWQDGSEDEDWDAEFLDSLIESINEALSCPD